jgi:hypothetical protein
MWRRSYQEIEKKENDFNENRQKTMNKKIKRRVHLRTISTSFVRSCKKEYYENAMITTMHELQYHLTTDASWRITSACFFQISKEALNTIMTSQLKDKFKTVMFMSFRLNDVETKYLNIEKKILIIVNALIEMRWLTMNNKWKIICYIDHHALNSIMTKKLNEYNCITT